MKWRKVKIKELGTVYDGPHATPAESDAGPVFLGIKNMTEDGRLNLTDIRHISEREYPKWTKRVKPQKDDVVFTYEATLHRYALLPADFTCCLGRRTALVRPKLEVVVPKFLLYYFLSPRWKSYIESRLIVGATVDRISITEFPEYDVELPELAIQQRIADILSAYDDLIENNLRRIQLLEEAARCRYKLMLQEHTSVDQPFSQLANFMNGFAFKPIHWLTEGLPIIKIKELKEGLKADTPRYHGRDIDEKYRVISGDILFSWSASLDAFLWAKGDALLNQHIFKVVPASPELYSFLLLALQEDMTKFRALSQGATMQHIKRSALDQVVTKVPTKEVLEVFEQETRPVLKLILNLKEQNGILQQARDILLPRLMSGEIDVSSVAMPQTETEVLETV